MTHESNVYPFFLIVLIKLTRSYENNRINFTELVHNVCTCFLDNILTNYIITI